MGGKFCRTGPKLFAPPPIEGKIKIFLNCKLQKVVGAQLEGWVFGPFLGLKFTTFWALGKIFFLFGGFFPPLTFNGALVKKKSSPQGQKPEEFKFNKKCPFFRGFFPSLNLATKGPPKNLFFMGSGKKGGFFLKKNAKRKFYFFSKKLSRNFRALLKKWKQNVMDTKRNGL